MTDQNIIDRFFELLAEESGNPTRQIWCSMADPYRPKGTQFLGAVVVNASGPATATHELNLRGLNLGGEIQFTLIPTNKRIPDEWTYRVMGRAEAENCPIVAAEEFIELESPR